MSRGGGKARRARVERTASPRGRGEGNLEAIKILDPCLPYEIRPFAQCASALSITCIYRRT